MRPRFFAAAFWMKPEWKMMPCFGVLPFFFNALPSMVSACVWDGWMDGEVRGRGRGRMAEER